MNDIQTQKQFGLLDRVPVGVCVLREDFAVLFWNRQLEEWTSISRGDILGTNIAARFPHLKQAKYSARLRQIFEGGPPTIFSSQLHKYVIPAPLPDGQLRSQQTTVTSVPAPGDSRNHALLVIEDVTDLTCRIQDYREMRDRAWEEIKERQRVELALRESEEQYRRIVETAIGGIWIIDVAGNTTFVNSQMAVMLGYTTDEMLGQPLLAFVDKQTRSLAESNMCRRHQSIEQQHDFKFRRKDGSDLWTIVSSTQIEDPAGEYIGALKIITDISDRKRAEEALRQQTEREQLMLKITQHIHRSLDLSEILNTTALEVREFLQTDRAIVFRFESNRSGVVMVESVGSDWRPILGANIYDPCLSETYDELYKQNGIRAIEDIYTADLSQCHLDLLAAFQVRANLVVPIRQSGQAMHDLHSREALDFWSMGTQETPKIQNRLWGLLIAHHCSSSRQWQQFEIELLNQLATQVAIAIQQAELYQQLQTANQELLRLATSDGLTGLANRRRFDEYLQQEWWRLARESLPLSLILCDIDFFKAYNDAYGHQAGDECLQRVAKAIARAVKRPADLVARYGGEEFAAILPSTDAEGALRVAEEIRLRVRSSEIEHGAAPASQYLTLSLGVASTVPAHERSIGSLFDAADRALYQAKAEGRNCVRVYQNIHAADRVL